MCVYWCISSQKQPTKPSTIGLQDKHVFLSVYLATTHMCLCVCVWGGGGGGGGGGEVYVWVYIFSETANQAMNENNQ